MGNRSTIMSNPIVKDEDDKISNLSPSQKNKFYEQYNLVREYFILECFVDTDGVAKNFEDYFKSFVEQNYDPDAFTIGPDIFNMLECQLQWTIRFWAYKRLKLIDYSVWFDEISEEKWLQNQKDEMKRHLNEETNAGSNILDSRVMRYKIDNYITLEDK